MLAFIAILQDQASGMLLAITMAAQKDTLHWELLCPTEAPKIGVTTCG